MTSGNPPTQTSSAAPALGGIDHTTGNGNSRSACEQTLAAAQLPISPRSFHTSAGCLQSPGSKLFKMLPPCLTNLALKAEKTRSCLCCLHHREDAPNTGSSYHDDEQAGSKHKRATILKQGGSKDITTVCGGTLRSNEL